MAAPTTATDLPAPWLGAVAAAVPFVLVGAFVTFPALLPGVGGGARLTDLVGVLALGMLALALVSGARLHAAAGPVAIAALLSLVWLGAELVAMAQHASTQRVQMVLVRWVLALATGYWLATLMDDPRRRTAIGLGLLAGLLLSLASLAIDHATFDPAVVVMTPEELENTVWLYEERRASGIFAHPNSAAGAILLLVPILIGLVEERRLPFVSLALGIIVVAAVFWMTRTRGPTMIAIVMLLWAMFGGTPLRRLAFLLLVPLAALLGLALAPPTPAGTSDPLLGRLLDAQNVATGSSDRLHTTLVSLDMALQHPFGLGSSYEAALAAATGFTATHNAYLQLALMGGLPIAAYVGWRLLRAAHAPRHRLVERRVAIYLLGAYLFENQFFVPTFSILTVWLLWRAPRRG